MSNHYSFYAMLHRMRYIKRWSLMRNSEEENLQEHTLEVAFFAHALALIRREISPYDFPVCPESCVMFALYHDVSEIITGDLPTPIKYFNEKIHRSFQEVEAEALGIMLQGMPEPLREDYEKVIKPDTEERHTQECLRIVKAADTLSAYIKCLDEQAAGNREFKDAEKTVREKLEQYKMPELDWFMAHCLDAFALTLDELREMNL